MDKFIHAVKSFFRKGKSFFRFTTFIANLLGALNVAFCAMSDKLLDENTEALKTYMESRKDNDEKD